MTYTLEELVFYFFVYGFLGWAVEVAIMAIQTGKFLNRGFLNLPVNFSCGLTMTALIVFLPIIAENWIFNIIGHILVVAVAGYLSGEISRRLLGGSLWDFSQISIFSGGRQGWPHAIALGGAALLMHLLVQPLIYLLGTLIPNPLLKIFAIAGSVLLFMDALSVMFAMRHKKLRPAMREFMSDVNDAKALIGRKMHNYIWRRLKKAYPDLKVDAPDSEKQYTFAQGVCMDKLIWVFIICALLGDLIETLFVGVQTGVIMSRSSVIYGTFSVVWGAGGVLLTLVLQRIAAKKGCYVFIAGFFIGGVYEYMCSVFTEVFLGTTFWDYSDMPFNIGGRTNLLFCFYWGILALAWVKALYPRLSSLIEKIPPVLGKIITWLLVLLFACDGIISGMAVLRYVERKETPAPSSALEVFIDYHYPDSFIEFVYPNMRIDHMLVAPRVSRE